VSPDSMGFFSIVLCWELTNPKERGSAGGLGLPTWLDTSPFRPTRGLPWPTPLNPISGSRTYVQHEPLVQRRTDPSSSKRHARLDGPASGSAPSSPPGASPRMFRHERSPPFHSLEPRPANARKIGVDLVCKECSSGGSFRSGTTELAGCCSASIWTIGAIGALMNRVRQPRTLVVHGLNDGGSQQQEQQQQSVESAEHYCLDNNGLNQF